MADKPESDVAARFPDHLRDESRRTGNAEAIVFASSAAEVAAALRAAAQRGQRVTIQGSRTGITAGAVPDGGLILCLARLDRILGVRFEGDDPFVRVQPGVTLNALRAFLDGAAADASGWTPAEREALARLRRGRWMFTPDPTEATASLGGMIACNASGACSFAHGPVRRHVQSLRVVLADGDELALARGAPRAAAGRFHALTAGGRALAGTLPPYAPPAVKNAAGYWVRPDMDLLDLFVGSEGTLGAIVEAELALRPRPPATWGVVCFLANEAQALDLVEWLRAPERAGASRPVAIEYFDGGVLDLLRQARQAGVHLPAVAPAWHEALYVEYAAPDEAAAAALGEALARRLAASGDPAASWAATDEHGLRRLKEFRHAAPEQVNLRIAERQRRHPGLTKLGTDLSVPDDRLRPVMALYRRDLAEAGLEHVVFGHIGDNHVHVNILPRDPDDYARGKALYEKWARQVVAWGGSVSAEHGIGKLKTGLLRVQYGADGIAAMRALKRIFDPQGRLNAGNLFPAGERAEERS
jgi:D-lactate dehydrogenase (cytochrome)